MRPHGRWQAGQATIEYLYVIPILLILLLGSLQFVFIYQAKQTLNYATFNGTRSGALNNGLMTAIQDGLVSGLTPMFVHDETLTALKTARKLALKELSDNRLARIQIINPTPAALSEYANSAGQIPNDNLMYRPTDAGSSGMNVQDANLLKVRVTYCVRMVVPIVNRMIYAFAVSKPATPDKIDTLSGTAGASGAGTEFTLDSRITAPEMLKVTPGSGGHGLCYDPDNEYPYRIPVTSEAVVRMQTAFGDPGLWVAPAP